MAIWRHWSQRAGEQAERYLSESRTDLVSAEETMLAIPGVG